MSLATSTRASREALSAMRYLLRHARTHFEARPAPASVGAAAASPLPPPRRDAHGRSAFAAYVVARYREGAAVRDRTQARLLRSHAAEFVSYLSALEEQKAVIASSKGADPDKPLQRAATARYVGLTVPEGIPLGAPVLANKYAASVAARLSGADPLAGSSLEGVDFLKAQLYGVKEVLDERRELAGGAEASERAAAAAKKSPARAAKQ